MELPGQIWKLQNIWFCQFEQFIWVGKFGKGLIPFNDFHCLQYLTLHFKYVCHDAMKIKSENLAHSLGYQIWAVTILSPLQESRPEIPRVGRGRGGKHDNP